MADELSQQERDDLVRRAIELDDLRFPPASSAGGPDISQDDFDRHSESFYLAIGDYFDGLPRVVMSVCPICGAPLERAFDPWGVDGAWWGIDPICTFSEPAACEHFRVLLGALRLEDGVVPARLVMDSQPGPDVPFVVPRLLQLPTMVAVVSKLRMHRGGPAYPVAYFSEVAPDDSKLHQPWRRTMLWYDKGAKKVWTAKNDPWDFDLSRWLKSGQLFWVELDGTGEVPEVQPVDDEARCPFVGLAGERRPQLCFDGERDLLDPPDGTPLNPFEEDGGS